MKTSHSPETRAKMSEATKKQWQNAESRAKLVEAMKGSSSKQKKRTRRTRLAIAASGLTAEQLRSLYDDGLSMRQIAIQMGLSYPILTSLMTEWQIPRRSLSETITMGYRKGRRRLLGADHPQWKGGRTSDKDGYVLILLPEHHKANKHGQVREHILVWEEAHKTLLPAGWVVHHLNGIKNDNRAENLLAIPKRSHHYALLLKGLRRRIRNLEAQLAQRRLTLA